MKQNAFINQMNQHDIDNKVDVIAELMQQDPQRAINIQVAEASKTWDETSNDSIRDVLTRIVLPTITASIGNALFWDLINVRGEAKYAATIQFSFTSFGTVENDSLADKTNFDRFKQTQSYDRTMNIDQTREIPYQVQAPQDYSLMSKGNVFQKFIGQNQKVITLFFENLILKTIVQNVPTENVREELINEALILGNTFKDDIIKLSNLLSTDILKIRNIGVGNKDKLISRMIEGGLNESNFVAVVSPTYELILQKTLAFSVAGAQASANAFSEGIRESGTYQGVRIIVGNRLGTENHYILLPVGELSPIGLGVSYMTGTYDKMLGTSKIWLSNLEFKYGIQFFDLFKDLIFMCKNPIAALVKPTATIGSITQSNGTVNVPITYNRGTRTTDEIAMVKLIPSTYTKLDTYVERGTNTYKFNDVKPNTYKVQVTISYIEGPDVVIEKAVTVSRNGGNTKQKTTVHNIETTQTTDNHLTDTQLNDDKDRKTLDTIAGKLNMRKFQDFNSKTLKEKIETKIKDKINKKELKDKEAQDYLTQIENIQGE